MIIEKRKTRELKAKEERGCSWNKKIIAVWQGQKKL